MFPGVANHGVRTRSRAAALETEFARSNAQRPQRRMMRRWHGHEPGQARRACALRIGTKSAVFALIVASRSQDQL